MKKLIGLAFFLIIALQAYADPWTVVKSNSPRYPLHFVMQEYDTVIIDWDGQILWLANPEGEIIVIHMVGDNLISEALRDKREGEKGIIIVGDGEYTIDQWNEYRGQYKGVELNE